MLFLHVGLHKTGTTYFQQEVFPHWKGIKYLRSLSVESFLKVSSGELCLASREGFSAGVLAHRDEKLTFLKRLSTMFPDARILISFRDHGSYLNAIYSQYLRYGGTLPVDAFFDLDGDSGFMKRDDLVFRSYVDGITEFWGRPPFVFLLSELKSDKRRLFAEMGRFFGVEGPNPERVSAGRRNMSLGRAQAEVLRTINAWAGVDLHRDGSTRPYRVLRRIGMDPPRLCQRWRNFGPVNRSSHCARSSVSMSITGKIGIISCHASRPASNAMGAIPPEPAMIEFQFAFSEESVARLQRGRGG
jgi:hypothetical protein